MTDITAFLAARLDEREHMARAVEHAVGDQYDALMAAIGETHQLGMVSLYWRSHDPARVLADVKAKRALIEDWRTYAERNRRDDCDEAAGSAWAAMSNVLVTLAGVHRYHPDYAGDSVDDWTWPDDDPAWRVE